MQEQEVLKIHPVALAFVGDAAYSLYVREKLIRSGEDKPIVYQKAAFAAVIGGAITRPQNITRRFVNALQ